MSQLRFDDGLTAPHSPPPRNIFSLPSSQHPKDRKQKPKTYGKKLHKRLARPASPLSPSASSSPTKPSTIPAQPNPTPPTTSLAGDEPQKPLSNREKKRLEKRALWEARVQALKKEDPKEPDEIEFLRRKREREREAAGSGVVVVKKRKKAKADEFPLLNGVGVARVLTPTTAEKKKKEKEKGDRHKGEGEKPDGHKAADKLAAQRQSLPIYPHQTALRQCLRDRDVLVMMGATGSGKSTQIGQFLLDESWMRGKCIAITQPRRVAAINLAKRVAAEMGVKLGEEVGYSVRFKNMSSDKTRIKFLTDGMLLQEMLADPMLRRYSAIVVDEAHERTVGTDLVMGFLRRLVYGERRGRLKVVVMSATLEVEAMAKFFEEHNGEGVMAPSFEAKEDSPEVKDEPHQEPDAEEDKKTHKKKKKKNKKKGQYNFQDLIRSPSPIPERILTPGNTQESGTTAATTTTTTTENAAEVIPYFGSVALFSVPGRQYPVEIYHTSEPVSDYLEAALKTVFQIHYQEPLPGDILVFLTGQEDIENLKRSLEQYAENMSKDVPKLLVLPLYAALPIHLQNKVFDPAPDRNTRKIILSTNIAETSVTVAGVRHVVDCGKSKQKLFRPKLGLESLLVTPISRSSALQRTGRAGREALGKCYRLFTEEDFNALVPATKPEILRTNIANAILILKARGQQDVLNFPYLSQPKTESLRTALEQLHALGALNNTGAITSLGRKMACLPLAPPLARVLLAAAEPALDCITEVVDIVAALSADNIFPPPSTADEATREAVETARSKFRRVEGDHLMLLEVVRGFLSAVSKRDWCETHHLSLPALKNMLEIRAQLRTYCNWEKEWDESSVGPDMAERVLKAFLKGYFHQTARAAGDGREYVTVLGHQAVAVHPASSLFGERREAVVYHEYVFTTRPFARWCSAVRLDWVAEAAPGGVKGEV